MAAQDKAQAGSIYAIYERTADDQPLMWEHAAILFHWINRWRSIAGDLWSLVDGATVVDGDVLLAAQHEAALEDYRRLANEWAATVAKPKPNRPPKPEPSTEDEPATPRGAA
jgi:hypothetical protein